MFRASKNSIYEELGIRPVIHAAGTKTTYGGTKIAPEVMEIMNIASQSFVSIEELNRKIGSYIAEISGAEAGMVTSGAASGMVLSAAACITGTNLAAIKKLPDTNNLKNEIITQKIHYGDYTHIYTFSGAKLVEVGNVNSCLPEELEGAITEKTAAISYLLGPRIYPTGLSLDEVVKIASSHSVPVIVDAAAMLPPMDNLRKYMDQGADLVTMSGGKFIHGPQSTGLLFGKKTLIDAALANASPNYAIGRPHKVSKENMVGLYAALKRAQSINISETFELYIRRLNVVMSHLEDIKTINIKVIQDEFNYHVPVLIIEFSKEWKGIKPKEILDLLIKGTPPIFMQYFKSLQHLAINPISLEEDELIPLGKRLKEILSIERVANETSS